MLLAILNTLKKIIIYTVVFCAVFISIVIAFLSYKPLVFNTNTPFVERFLNIQGNQLKLGKISVWFDGSLHLKGEDGEIFAADDKQKLNIGKLEVEFSNTNLIFGRLAPKHVYLEGLSLDVNIEREAFYIAGFPLKTNQSDNEEISLIDYLNQKEGLNPYFSSLKTLKMQHINLNVFDDVNIKSWLIKNGDIFFSRSFRKGEILKIKGGLARSSLLAVTPVNIEFSHPKYADSATLNVKLKNAKSKFFDDYIPFSNPIKTNGEITLKLDLLSNNVIKNTNMIMKMEKGTIHASTAYNFPFAFKSGYMDVNYSNENNGLVTINKLSIIDKENLALELKGTIKNVLKPKTLDFDLNLTSSGETTISHIASYLPDKKINDVTNWIRTNVNSSKVSNFRLSYNGKPNELPFCDKKCGFDGSFDFKDFSLVALKKAPPIRNLVGTFEMKEDYIKITSKTGMWDNQLLENVEVVIAGYFTKGVKDGITINGTASGSIQGAIDIIEKSVSAKNPGVIKVAGSHVSKGYLYMPLKNLNYGNVRFNYRSEVENVETTSIIKNIDARIKSANILITQDEIKLESKGTLNGLNVNYDWRENMQRPFKETLLSISGNLPPETLMALIKPTEIEVLNAVPVTLSVKANDKGHYNYTFLSDMKNNVVSQNVINLKKEMGMPLTVIGKGVYDGQNKLLPLNLSVVGENIDIHGDMFLGENFSADFNRFNFEKNKLKVAIKSSILNLTGEQLDISFLDLLSNDAHVSNSQKSIDLNITANVENILLKDGNFENVSVNMERKNEQWQHIEMTAGASEKPVEFTLKHPSEGHMSLHFEGENAGEALKSVGLIKTLRGGHALMDIDVYTVDGKKQGKGIIKIKKANLVKAPILAKLLSLISLREVLSSKEGIYFDDIEIPLLFVGDEIIIDHAYLSGPSIGLRLKGKINTITNVLNIEGQLIPAEGINSFIGKIPFLGTLLTGSQEGLLVADFSVKGTKKYPKVTANPLSFVMPGLIKDFFGTLFGAEDITKPIKYKQINENEIKK